MNRNSIRILAVAVMAAIVLSAAVISASPKALAAHENKTDTAKNAYSSDTAREGKSAASEKPRMTSAKITELRMALRDLWVDHVVWTRLYIISAVADAPDTDFAAQRLLKNQEDIGNAIKPFYGEETGNKLASLLKDHILIAVDLLDAAKAGDSEGAQSAEQRWYENADDIATFLSDANPNWSKEHLAKMLNKHLALTKSEAVARLTGNYEEDIAAFDEIKSEAMMMADDMARGIVKQARSGR
jgi:hypothetical protein